MILRFLEMDYQIMHSDSKLLKKFCKSISVFSHLLIRRLIEYLSPNQPKFSTFLQKCTIILFLVILKYDKKFVKAVLFLVLSSIIGTYNYLQLCTLSCLPRVYLKNPIVFTVVGLYICLSICLSIIRICSLVFLILDPVFT